MYISVFISAPSAPTNLRIEGADSTVLMLSWGLPITPNGNIITYTIIYWINDEEDSARTSMVVDGNQPRQTTINRLLPYTVYGIEVRETHTHTHTYIYKNIYYDKISTGSILHLIMTFHQCEMALVRSKELNLLYIDNSKYSFQTFI